MRPRASLGAFLALTLLAAPGCHRNRELTEDFDELVSEFVHTSLSFSPVAATGAGYHVHEGTPLDDLLDDYSDEGVRKQRQFYESIKSRLDRFSPRNLDPPRQADLKLMGDQVEANLLEFDTIQNYHHNPTLYVESVGTALFQPYVLQYASLEDRFRHIVARLEKLPAFLDTARHQLQDSPELWNQVARDENAGNIDLIEKTLREKAPAAVRDSYDKAAKPAAAALRSFNDWLAKELSQHTSTWRLGPDAYSRKFRFVIGTGEQPESLLAAAENELALTRRKMMEIARPLLPPELKESAEEGRINLVLKAVLDRIAQKHATPRTYFSDAQRDLDEVRAFVRDHHLLRLPSRDNLQVIETPEFMRGIYSVGGFNAAPALEPSLGAYYWLTPIPANWPAARIDSKLREYNYYGLKLLTIHEAIPGHYVQFEYANAVTPEPRRLLRSVYGSGPYVEGWAVYATEMMLDAGYLNNSPELRLTFLKHQLRVITNAILDIGMQMREMSDEEAMRLLTEQAFQEKEEAEGKLVRAKLSSAQLPTYFAGYRSWKDLRSTQERRLGSSFDAARFHEQALQAGAVPLRLLPDLLSSQGPDSTAP